MKSPNLNQKLYINFRQFVKDGELGRYDDEYFSVKRHSFRFMVDLLYKFTDLDSIKKNQNTPTKLLELLGKFENKNKTQKNKNLEEIKKAKLISIQTQRKYLFKNPL